jgi:hypothetical protein
MERFDPASAEMTCAADDGLSRLWMIFCCGGADCDSMANREDLSRTEDDDG